MKRKIILRLSYLAAMLAIFWSCHNEDFAKGETEPQRNNADFFRHPVQNGAAARSGVDYAAILEAYNQENDFLSTMPDQQGMPIWEKMQAFANDKVTGLIIPLSHDHETLSSVLFATLDNNNRIIGVKDYDNYLLKDMVYNEKINQKFREQMLYTFMMVDNYTFGTVDFTNVPKNIFKGQKYDEENGRIQIKDFAISPDAAVQNNESGKILFIESCGSNWSCKNHESWSKCDHCPACYSTSCSTVMIYIEDEGFPGSPGSPGGGGGGGGGGTPGPEPPKDPCALTTVFYRLKPGCLGSGTGIDDPFDPCKIAKPAIDSANKILHKPMVQQKMDAVLKQKAGSLLEYGVAVGNNGNEVTNPRQGTASSVTPPFDELSNPNSAIAAGHSHATAFASPSGGDVYSLLTNKINYPNLLYSFVYGKTPNGIIETYVMVIHDVAAAATFLNNYPKAANYNSVTHDLEIRSDLGKEFGKMRDIYNYYYPDGIVSGEYLDKGAMALAYMFEKLDSGISLAKVDVNGNLQKINASLKKITNSNGVIEEKPIIQKCP